MKKNRLIIAALGAAGLSLSLLSVPSYAIPMATCGSKSAGPALSCTDGTGPSDNLSRVQAAYPQVDFLFDKDEGETPPPPFDDADFYLTDLSFDDINYGNTTDGFFFLSDRLLLAGFDINVLVLKGGNDDPKWSMFEIDTANLVDGTGEQEDYSYGQWSSTDQGLSHASLYVGDSGEQIPEPGTLALLGLGLTGLGLSRRKKAG